MATDFFKKRRWAYFALACLFFCVSILSLAYACYLKQTKAVWHGRGFYFLLSNTEHVEAGVFFAQNDGGAGYLLQDLGEARIVLSVYLNEKDGLGVQSSFSEETELRYIGVDYLYFKTKEEKERAEIVENALKNLYSCMQVLEAEIYRLDKGATQQSVLNILKLLKKEFCGLRKIFQEDYSAFSLICHSAISALEEMENGIIYAKDLRYLLCELAVGYIQLTKEFSL